MYFKKIIIYINTIFILFFKDSVNFLDGGEHFFYIKLLEIVNNL